MDDFRLPPIESVIKREIPPPSDYYFASSEDDEAASASSACDSVMDLSINGASNSPSTPMMTSFTPGLTDFDPAERHFSLDELRPQPIVRKRNKRAVPAEQKDAKYWNRRLKNNVAARRSREARRMKENQIAMRAAFLESENDFLRRELDAAVRDNRDLAYELRVLAARLDRELNKGPN